MAVAALVTAAEVNAITANESINPFEVVSSIDFQPGNRKLLEIVVFDDKKAELIKPGKTLQRAHGNFEGKAALEVAISLRMVFEKFMIV